MLKERTAGTLLHITSLPSSDGAGDLGSAAYSFIDWLAETGQRWWQMLPLDPPGPGYSPYSSRSAFAINPLMISIEKLSNHGIAGCENHDILENENSDRINWSVISTKKYKQLIRCAMQWIQEADSNQKSRFKEFVSENEYWLIGYAQYSVLSRQHGYDWSNWNKEFIDKDELLETDAVQAVMVLQWWADQQWNDLKQYANSRGIKMLGDLPLYMSYESADVWCHPELFKLDENKRPKRIAGVPPDYFNEDGQLWGMPVYEWLQHEASGFEWWKRRLNIQLKRFDQVRLDHFRGIVDFWEIPAGAETARFGWWRKGPGNDLLRALCDVQQPLPVIAEDLGIISSKVYKLRDRFHLPGMSVLQFAFNGRADNPHLPSNIGEHQVVYTGTHDNNTSEGWYNDIAQYQRRMLNDVALSHDIRITVPVYQKMIRLALLSSAKLAIIPMQDWLGLPAQARMNKPGIASGNWRWKLQRKQLEQIDQEWVKQLISAADR